MRQGFWAYANRNNAVKKEREVGASERNIELEKKMSPISTKNNEQNLKDIVSTLLRKIWQIWDCRNLKTCGHWKFTTIQSFGLDT